MGTFTWRNDFSVGVEEMDNQHKKFFDYLNQLEEAAGGSKGGEVVGRVLEQLHDYIAYHFSEEENLLGAKGYPDLNHQIKQHEFFISQVADLQKEYSKGGPYVPLSTLEFLRDWYSRHILESDKKYGVYLSKVEG